MRVDHQVRADRGGLGETLRPAGPDAAGVEICGPVGQHPRRAIQHRTRNAAGNIGVSASVSVTVSNIVVPANNSSFISQSVPATMTAGQTYSVSVVMKNTGTATWTKAAAYKLGTQNPQDNNLWLVSANRVELGDAESIAPGQSKTFTFNVKAPSAAGTYNFQWKMLREGLEWFGDTSMNASVIVQSPAGNTLPTVSITFPANGASVSGPITVSVSAANSIGVSVVELYVDDALKGSDKVLPYTFTLDSSLLSNAAHVLTAKAYDAAGNIGASASVSVTVFNTVTLVNSAQFVSQSVPASMAAGQTYSVSVTMKNTGTATWTKLTGYKLGSQNPQDNTVWLAATNRADLGVADAILPGQAKTFSFSVKAPASAGTYNFQWKMIREGVEWFGDLSANAAVAVNSAADATFPTVSITAPANGAGVAGPINVSAKAADNINFFIFCLLPPQP